jgi:hypothetical protein
MEIPDDLFPGFKEHAGPVLVYVKNGVVERASRCAKMSLSPRSNPLMRPVKSRSSPCKSGLKLAILITGLNNPSCQSLCHGENRWRRRTTQKLYPLTPAITYAGVSVCLSHPGGAI